MGAEGNVTNRATIPAKAGGSRQATAVSGLVVPLAALILVFLGMLVYAKHLRNIVPLGLPATIILGVGFYFAMKYLRETAGTAIDRAKVTGRETGAK